MMTSVVCTPTADPAMRVFSAVLLRRLLIAGKEFSKVTPAEQQDIKRNILACLTTPDMNAVPRPLRRSLVHCVCSVAVAGVEGPPPRSLETAWPEVLPTLAGLCQPTSPVALRESGYELLRRLVEAVPTAMLPHRATLLQNVSPVSGAGWRLRFLESPNGMDVA